jgi:hypothetical protein
MRTSALFRFDETEAVFPPNDAAANVAPLTPVAAGQHPAVVTGAVGYARRFAAGYAFKGTEAVVGSTLLRRSMTVQAILTYAENGGVQTLACRGKKTGTAAERRLFAVSIVRSGGLDVVRVEWDRSSGAAATVPDLTVELPSTFFHLAVTRDWVSATEVLVTVYGNGEQLGAAVTSAHGDIEDGDAGELTVGARWNQTTLAYDSYYAGDVDELKVSNEALSAEEIKHEYRRMFVYPAELYDLTSRCLPPGVAFTTEPTSKLQRIVRMVRLPPTPGDRLATRRQRLTGFLQRIHGYSREQIKAALSQLLGLPPAQLVSVASSNMRTEAFAGASVPTYFTQEPNAGTLGVAGGKLDVDSQIGDDARWTAAAAVPVRVRTSVAADEGMEVIANVVANLAENGAMCGIYVRSVSGNADHLFGLQRVAGVDRFFHRLIEGGVVTELVGGSPVGMVTSVWLKLTLQADGQFVFEYRSDGTTFEPINLLAVGPVATFASAKDWTGVFVGCDTNPCTAANGMDVLDFRIWCPRARHVFQTFLYRDPLLAPTAYDRLGAQAVYNGMRPGHQQGTVIESLAFVVGSPYSRVDGEPVGP